MNRVYIDGSTTTWGSGIIAPQSVVIIDDVRYVCGSQLTKRLIRWFLDNCANLQGSGQFVIDYGMDGFTPHRKEDYPKVKLVA